jgi:hypothetical protein
VTVRRIGLSAAGLLASVLLGLSLVTNGVATPNGSHTCSATDRQFIETARTNMTALGLWADQYLHGDAAAGDVIGETKQATQLMQATSPTDPSLSETRSLMTGMFTEYGKAIRADSRHKNSGPHMYRAYGLANFAHDVLEQARPALVERGCDVTPLL